MGYAKRKKQRKALENISNESNTKLLNIEDKESRPNEEHGLSIAIEYLTNIGLYPKHKINPEEVVLANSMNFLIELDGLDFYHKDRTNTFDWGRLEIFKAVSQRLLDEEKMSREDFKFMANNVKEAALKMYQIENMTGLHDPLIWLFIPKSWQRWIDGCFDGVGEWKA
jgi:hypothetical protein